MNTTFASMISNSSFKALEAMAIKATVAALSAKARGGKQPRKPKPKKALCAIDHSLRSVCIAIDRMYSEGYTVKYGKTNKLSTSHTEICVFRTDDLHAYEAALRASKDGSTASAQKAKMPMPVDRYVLYADHIDPTRLGSVAIYCDNPRMRLEGIVRLRSLFGMPIKKAELAMGRRAFIDVTMA